MPTKELEEFLERHEAPIEATTTLDAWLDYLESRLGMKGGSLNVGEEIYNRKFNIYPQLEIKQVEWTRQYRYQKRRADKHDGAHKQADDGIA